MGAILMSSPPLDQSSAAPATASTAAFIRRSSCPTGTEVYRLWMKKNYFFSGGLRDIPEGGQAGVGRDQQHRRVVHAVQRHPAHLLARPSAALREPAAPRIPA